MVRRYTPFDLPMIADWFAHYKLGSPEPSLLPAFGLIEPDVACGFLFETNCKLAMIDGLISSPYATAAERDRAVDEIGHGLIEEARNRGFTRIMGISALRSVVRRAMTRHGFSMIGNCVILGREV